METGPLIPSNGRLQRDSQSLYTVDRSKEFVSGLDFLDTNQDAVLPQYLRVLKKRKWAIISCVVVIFTLVAIASFRMTPMYDAVGRIAINKPSASIISFKDNAVGVDEIDPTDLDTEVRILQSDLLALQVIKQLNLEQRPDFGAKVSAPADNSMNLGADPLQTDSKRAGPLLSKFKSGLKVSLIPSTRIIEIKYASHDPQLAATVVNTLASTYVEQTFKTRFESTMQASDWLSKQLVDLQMKVETSQEKLVQYQKQHEILGTDEKENIVTEKLGELNRELTAAQAERIQKESVDRLVQSGDPDVIASLASSDHGGSGGGVGLLEKLNGQQMDLKIQMAQLSSQFGPSYPKLVQLNDQSKEIDSQVKGELKKVATKVHNDYLAALQRESMLNAGFEKQKQEQNKLNESAIEYSMLKRDVDTNRQLYESLLERLKEAGVSAGLKSNNVKLIDPARVPVIPSEPNIPTNLAFALLLGLTSGVGLAFLMENLDNTISTPEQAQAIASLPSLGMIPLAARATGFEQARRQLSVASSPTERVELVSQSRPHSQMAEAYRALRTSLLLSSIGKPPKVILVTSSTPQEGKTTTSVNCALVLAQKGVRVLLIDADLRRPGIHKILGLVPRYGLSNLLSGSASLQQAISHSAVLPELSVISAGLLPPNPAELLASAEMKELIYRLSDQYDHIVIDSPPALSVTDAVVLSTLADAVILVIRAGKTTKQALRRTREILARVNAKTVGVLVNAVDFRSADYSHYYEYQGKYGETYWKEDAASPTEESDKSTPEIA